jgi:hypothetical protein
MDALRNATERGSQPELGLIGDLAALRVECGYAPNMAYVVKGEAAG